jgi:hypothetical protein
LHGEHRNVIPGIRGTVAWLSGFDLLIVSTPALVSAEPQRTPTELN